MLMCLLGGGSYNRKMLHMLGPLSESYPFWGHMFDQKYFRCHFCFKTPFGDHFDYWQYTLINHLDWKTPLWGPFYIPKHTLWDLACIPFSLLPALFVNSATSYILFYVIIQFQNPHSFVTKQIYVKNTIYTP